MDPTPTPREVDVVVIGAGQAGLSIAFSLRKQGFEPGGGFVVLDTAVTPELAAEGLARDVVRVVQQARRDAGLAVGDRITLQVTGRTSVAAAVQAHADLIGTETLGTVLEVREQAPGSDGVDIGDKQRVAVAVSRI